MLYSHPALVDVCHSLYVITFSADTLKANIFSVVLLPALYAACVIGILLDSFSLVLLIIHMARIFLITESRMMGLRFAVGPCGGTPVFLLSVLLDIHLILLCC